MGKRLEYALILSVVGLAIIALGYEVLSDWRLYLI